MQVYNCKYFSIHELVPPNVYRAHYDLCWYFFDINALITLDLLRARYGTCIVNNWFWNGDFTQSGFRSWDASVGARLSQHKFGRAFDCKFVKVTSDEVRDDMKKSGCFKSPVDIPYEFQRIARIEAFKGMSWFHFDVAPVHKDNGIAIIGEGHSLN